MTTKLNLKAEVVHWVLLVQEYFHKDQLNNQGQMWISMIHKLNLEAKQPH